MFQSHSDDRDSVLEEGRQVGPGGGASWKA